MPAAPFAGVRLQSIGYGRGMSTPPSESPRLPDSEKAADGDDPDMNRQNPVPHASRIPEEERGTRIPYPEE